MDRKSTEDIIEIAQEFIDLAKSHLAAIDQDLKTHHEQRPDIWDGIRRPGDRVYGNKISGSLRRKSLDLTRALADFRRP